jgi:hypothetical protein
MLQGKRRLPKVSHLFHSFSQCYLNFDQEGEAVSESIALLKVCLKETFSTYFDSSARVEAQSENPAEKPVFVSEICHYTHLYRTKASLGSFAYAKPAYFITRFLDTIADDLEFRFCRQFEFVRSVLNKELHGLLYRYL